MQLKKVYFDAYKSLLKKELELTDSCTGFVGINESGKSNVLTAISVLSTDNKLKMADTPKMGGVKPNPTIRFEFVPDEEEKKEVEATLREWAGDNIVLGDEVQFKDFTI